jgi:hypothetical protein
MRSRRSVAIAAAAIVGALLAGPAHAAPATRTEVNYFQCSDTNKVQNLTNVPAGWSLLAPTQSVREGAGCGFADHADGPFRGGPALFRGQFRGNLDRITVDLDNIYVGPSRNNAAAQIDADFIIEDLGTITRTFSVTPRTLPGNTASQRFTFVLDDIGLLAEEGQGTRLRTIEIRVRNRTDPVNTWVFGTTEVPGGVTFN